MVFSLCVCIVVNRARCFLVFGRGWGACSPLAGNRVTNAGAQRRLFSVVDVVRLRSVAEKNK